MSDLNICMFSRLLPVHSLGGVEVNSMLLARCFAARGLPVTIISTSLSESARRSVERKVHGVRVIQLPVVASDSRTRTYGQVATDEFARLHSQSPFSIVHSHDDAGWPIYKAGLLRRFNLPLVITWYGTHLDYILCTLRADFLSCSINGLSDFCREIVGTTLRFVRRDWCLSRHADAIIAIDTAALQKIHLAYGVKVRKIHWIPTCADAHRFHPVSIREARERLRIVESRPTILVVARLVREKGVQNIIRALAMIRCCEPAVQLLVVGDGPYEVELRRLVDELRLYHIVRFVGRVAYDQLPYYYSACDLFIDPTLEVGSYNTTNLQAMLCERPVVVTRGNGIEDIIHHGKHGFLVRKGRVEEIEGFCAMLLGNPELAKSMGLQARIRVAKKFNLDRMSDDTLALYKKILNSKPQGGGYNAR